MTPHRLADLTSLQVGALAAADAVLAVPVGACEQHGPHLPLGTDSDIGIALCTALATARQQVVLAPAVSYGSSGEHDGFAGTVSIGQDALEHLLIELGRSAAATFTRILLVSTHGGNAAPVTRAVQVLRGEGRNVCAWGPSSADSDAHAGRTETSIQLALNPGRVDLSAAQIGNTRPLVELLPMMRNGGVCAVSANGVLGDPRGASAEHGRKLLEQLTAQLVTFVDDRFGPATTTAGCSDRHPRARAMP